jgi:hypothetical protein
MAVAHLVAACLLVLAMAPPAPAAPQPSAAFPATIDTTNEAGEDDDPEPRRKLVKWNEYKGLISTVRFGFGILTDAASYVGTKRQQVAIDNPDIGVRDARIFFGAFPDQRPLTWTSITCMTSPTTYGAFATPDQIGLPEMNGSLFIGRTKEGYSMVKVMAGHPTGRRSGPRLDVRADSRGRTEVVGSFKAALLRLGAFADGLSEESFRAMTSRSSRASDGCRSPRMRTRRCSTWR